MKTETAHLLFAGSDYYASGGMNDYYGLFHTEEHAVLKGQQLVKYTQLERYKTRQAEWFQVVRLSDLRVIAFYGEPHNGGPQWPQSKALFEGAREEKL